MTTTPSTTPSTGSHPTPTADSAGSTAAIAGGGGDLVVSNISKRFSGVQAVADVSVTVRPGQVHGLVGPNGAGKSTALGVISGFIACDSGSIVYGGRDVTGFSPDRLVRAGVARTFQEPSPIAGLTVLENALIGLHIQGRAGTIQASWRSPLLRREEKQLRVQALALLESVGLGARAQAQAVDLSFGELRYLEVVRALGTGAKMLLLDEPAAGMGKTEMDRLAAVIDQTRRGGRGVLLVDHDMRFIFGLCDVITVMDYGRVIAHGTPAEIENNQTVRDAYLGGDSERHTTTPASASAGTTAASTASTPPPLGTTAPTTAASTAPTTAASTAASTAAGPAGSVSGVGGGV
jgi:branched-chain amino acid transport system ATP-binding protein